MKKYLSIILSLVMVVTYLSGCGGKKNQKDQSSDATPGESTTAASIPGATDPEGSDNTTGENGETTQPSTATTQDVFVDAKSKSGPMMDGKLITKLANKNIKYLWWNPIDEKEQEWITAFEKQYGAKLEPVMTTWDNMDSKLIAMIAAGDAPDVAYLHGSKFPLKVIQNVFRPIDKYINWDDIVYDQSKMQNFKWNGKYYGYSGTNSSDLFALIYNKTMFKKAGLTEPLKLWEQGKWTWEAFRNAAKKLTVDENKDGKPERFGFSGSFMAWMGSNAESWVKYTGTGQPTQNLTDGSVKATLQFMNDLYNVDKSAENDWQAANFWLGKAAMTLDYTYQAAKLKKNNVNDEWDFCGVPQGPNNTSGTQTGGMANSWGIPIGDNVNVEGAVALIYSRMSYVSTSEAENNILTPAQIQRSNNMFKKAVSWNTSYGEMDGDTWAIIRKVTEEKIPVNTVVTEHATVWGNYIQETMKKAQLITKPTEKFNAPKTINFEDNLHKSLKMGTVTNSVVTGADTPNGSAALQIENTKAGRQTIFTMDSSMAKFVPGYTYTITCDVKYLKNPKLNGAYYFQFFSPSENRVIGSGEFTGTAGQNNKVTLEIGLIENIKDVQLQFGTINGTKLTIDNISISAK